jgi:hypothetical protein
MSGEHRYTAPVRRHVTVAVLAAALAASCFPWPHPGRGGKDRAGHAHAHDEPQTQVHVTRCEPEPEGTPADLHVVPGAAPGAGARPGAGPMIDAPVTCGNDTYIAVHGRVGGRRFVMGPEGAKTGCKAPPPPDEPAACPEVFVDAFAQHLYLRLQSRSLYASRGIGQGPCAGAGAGAGAGAQPPVYADVHYSVMIQDWRQADAVIAAVDEELRVWGVGDVFGVSVMGKDCYEPQPEPTTRGTNDEVLIHDD